MDQIETLSVFVAVAAAEEVGPLQTDLEALVVVDSQGSLEARLVRVELGLVETDQEVGHVRDTRG
jgi:hypothetical protein